MAKLGSDFMLELWDAFFGGVPERVDIDEISDDPIVAGKDKGSALNRSWSDKEKWVVTVDMPGVKKEDINIDFSYNSFSITGVRDGETRQYFRGYLSSRIGGIPEYDFDKAVANLQHGVLTLTIPATQTKSVKIEVQGE